MIIDLPPHVEQQIVQIAKQQGKTAENIASEIIQNHLPQRVERPFDYDMAMIDRAMQEKFVEVPKGVADDLDTFTQWVKENFT